MFQYLQGEEVVQKYLPAEDAILVEKLTWGNVSKVFTPAYWKSQLVMAEECRELGKRRYRTSDSLADEVCACLLGGYGVPAEMGYAAFLALKQRGIIKNKGVSSERRLYEKILEVLSQPLMTHKGLAKYRFPKQKAMRVAAALMRISLEPAPDSASELRKWLLSFSGIGPKTASWIVRNWTGSDDVAIIDIHIFRACTLMGLFRGSESIERDYDLLEQKYVALAKAMKVRTSDMDIAMWSGMRKFGHYGLNAFKKLFNK